MANKKSLSIILISLFVSISLSNQIRFESLHYDVIKYTLNLDIYKCFLPPYPASFSASVLIHFEAATNMDYIFFNALNSSLKIDSVGGSGKLFEHSNDILKIELGKSLSPGDTASVEIFYNHKNVRDSAFYTGNGLVYTDCESQKARNWFPCDDTPSDKAFLDLIVKTPRNVKLGSNGLLTDSLISGDSLYYHWQTNYPIATYLIVIVGSKDFKLDTYSTSCSGKEIPIRFYWKTWEDTLSIKNIERRIIPMNNFFSKLFGEYPFEKIGFATVDSSFPWGGMENQTMITLCPTCWMEDLIVHEFAHQWFGDMISPGTWADIWLNESFATYCEALWDEEIGGQRSYKLTIKRLANEYFYFNPHIAIYNKDWINNLPDDNLLFNSAIVYNKGACVLHMLRYLIGDIQFFEILQSYTSNPNLRYRNAVTKDFINVTDSITGQDLKWFFDQWLTREDHPIYKIKNEIHAIAINKWEVVSNIRQVQQEKFYKMPVEIKLIFKDRSDTLVQVDNDVNNQTFKFHLEKEPINILFDPNNNIVLKEILRD